MSGGLVRATWSARILTEYNDALRRATFPFSADDVDSLLAQIAATGEVVAAAPLTEHMPAYQRTTPT